MSTANTAKTIAHMYDFELMMTSDRTALLKRIAANYLTAYDIICKYEENISSATYDSFREVVSNLHYRRPMVEGKLDKYLK